MFGTNANNIQYFYSTYLTIQKSCHLLIPISQQFGEKECVWWANLTLYQIVLQYCWLLAVDIKLWQSLRCLMWGHLGVMGGILGWIYSRLRINWVIIPWEESLGFPTNSKTIPISGIFWLILFIFFLPRGNFPAK